jgi:uncharacterized protein (TIGR02996 family)
VCAPCRLGEKNETANPLWVAGGDSPAAIRAALETAPGDPIWWALKKRLDGDRDFVGRVAAEVGAALADRCAIEQSWMITRLPGGLWGEACDRPEVKDAQAAAGARDAHERRLLTAIDADPAIDEPRLVYADWLLEQPTAEERARGERVHAEVQLATLSDGDPRAAELRATLTRLWASPVALWWRRRAFGAISHRGAPLIHEDERTLGDDAPVDPWILGAAVHEPSSEMWHMSEHQLHKAPHLARYSALDLAGLDDSDAAPILGSPYLGRLTFLRIELTGQMIEALPRALPELVELELSGSGSSEPDLAPVFARELPRLRRVLVAGPKAPRLTGQPVEVAHRPDRYASRARLVP